MVYNRLATFIHSFLGPWSKVHSQQTAQNPIWSYSTGFITQRNFISGKFEIFGPIVITLMHKCVCRKVKNSANSFNGWIQASRRWEFEETECVVFLILSSRATAAALADSETSSKAITAFFIFKRTFLLDHFKFRHFFAPLQSLAWLYSVFGFILYKCSSKTKDAIDFSLFRRTQAFRWCDTISHVWCTHSKPILYSYVYILMLTAYVYIHSMDNYYYLKKEFLTRKRNE